MNNPVVLVIEDDAPVRNLIVTTLKTHDYRYLTAKNGAEAIMMASSHNPDVLFLDLGLPDMDGIDVIRQVRSWSNMPIIIISARSDDADKRTRIISKHRRRSAMRDLLERATENTLWASMSAEEKNRQLFRKQKELLDLFLEKGAISREQHDRSLRDLRRKMKL